jgi:hypothetical protein
VVQWQFNNLAAGRYRVSVNWVPFSNRATDAPFTVKDGSASLATVPVNQELAPDDFTAGGVAWESLGEFTVSSGVLSVQLSDNANEYVMADGVRIDPVDAGHQIIDDNNPGYSHTAGWIVYEGGGYLGDTSYIAAGVGANVATYTFTGLTPGMYQVSANWVPHPNRATNAPFTIKDGATPVGTVLVNQELAPNDFSDAGAFWEGLGTFTITGSTLVVELSDNANEYVLADGVRIDQVSARSSELAADPSSAAQAEAFFNSILDRNPALSTLDAALAHEPAGTQNLPVSDDLGMLSAVDAHADSDSSLEIPAARLTENDIDLALSDPDLDWLTADGDELLEAAGLGVL